MSVIKVLGKHLPLCVSKNREASCVTLGNRLSGLLFGSPNWRRGNGIIGTSFEAEKIVKRAASHVGSLLGIDDPEYRMKSAPVFSAERRGTLLNERLPKIWLSECVSNTDCDLGRRVFTECYPCGKDEGGVRAYELAERYASEGLNCIQEDRETGVECMKAAELLLMHAMDRGNGKAGSLLGRIYREHLPEGDRWLPILEEKARHFRRDSRRKCLDQVCMGTCS